MGLSQSIDISRHMDAATSIKTLSALAQETRLDVFRRLVAAEPDGLAAGEIARTLDVPHNTLSTHLSILSAADLINSRRDGRSIIYRADLEALRAVITYLVNDCCAGRPELCAPLIAELSPSCNPIGGCCG